MLLAVFQCCGSGWQVAGDRFLCAWILYSSGKRSALMWLKYIVLRRRGACGPQFIVGLSLERRAAPWQRREASGFCGGSLGFARDFACGLKRPQNGSTPTRLCSPSLLSESLGLDQDDRIWAESVKRKCRGYSLIFHKKLLLLKATNVNISCLFTASYTVIGHTRQLA